MSSQQPDTCPVLLQRDFTQCTWLCWHSSRVVPILQFYWCVSFWSLSTVTICRTSYTLFFSQPVYYLPDDSQGPNPIMTAAEHQHSGSLISTSAEWPYGDQKREGRESGCKTGLQLQYIWTKLVCRGCYSTTCKNLLIPVLNNQLWKADVRARDGKTWWIKWGWRHIPVDSYYMSV